jgi:uncharacterized lipoprotein YmbA
MSISAARYAPGLSIVALLGLAGCAGNVPKASFSHPIATDARIAANDQAVVSVDAADSAKMLSSDMQRLSEKIKLKIDARKLANASPAGDPHNYAVDVHVTRYEKGNAFARAMLAGLGQIHLDATVSVYRMPAHTLVGEFQLAKTFAWGGIYGASTSMDDIENTFADGIAASVTGQEEGPPKQKT